MKITNNKNWPGHLYNAIKGEDYIPNKEKFCSITDLIKTAKEFALKKKFDDEIGIDISDLVRSFIGKAIHKAVEVANKNDYRYKVEEKYEMTVNVNGKDYLITGKTDLLDLEKELSDYKTILLNGYNRENFEDNEFQLNLYVYLYHKNGVKVEKISNTFIILDWTKMKLIYNKDCTDSQIKIRYYDIWPLEKTEQKIKEKIIAFEKALAGDPPDCTDKERWKDPDKWAIKKGNNKNAIRGGICSTEKEAKDKLEKLGKPHWIEFRPSSPTKCIHYCSVSNFCKQYQEEIKNESTN